VGVTIYGVFIGGGLDASLKVSLLPVTFTTTIKVEDFHPLKMNVPKFDVTAEVSTGVQLSAALMPYIAAGLGVGPLFAGIKLKGIARLNVPVKVSASLHLKADSQNFSGELGVGAKINPNIEIGFQPVVYAEAGGAKTDELELMEEVKYTFPDLFCFEWNKKWTFGDQGSQESEGGGAPQETVAEEEAKQEGQAPVDGQLRGNAVGSQRG
jgi:hypothetical protein